MKKIIIAFIKEHFLVVLIVVLSFWAILPLMRPGFFTMHDDQQIARLFEMKDAISAGQFPVRWTSRLGFGFGYPIFNFYPPLIYYIGLLFTFLGFSLILSTKLVIGLGFLLSSLFMYAWVRKHHGKLAGFVSAILYMYAPYHIVDVYVRGALSEFFSFVWIPAVFWSFDTLAEKKTPKWSIVSGVFLSFVVLTHNLVALPFIPFLSIYLLYLIVREKKNIRQVIKTFLLSGLIALGLSAFFWLPALAEKKFTLVDAILTKELASYKIHFVAPEQLWQSPWGFGGSTQGTGDGLSLKVGKVHILVSLLSVVLIKLAFFKKRKISFHTLLIFLLFILSLFMTTVYSKFLWDYIQPLAYLQFPWRFLLFGVVFSSFLGGALVGEINRYNLRFITTFVGIIVAIYSIYLMVPYTHPQEYLNFTDKNYIENQDIEWRVSSKSFEYMSRGTATKLSPLNTTIININQEEIPKKSYTIISKDMKVKELKNTPAQKSYSVKSSGGKLQINTNFFPGWTAYIDSRQVPITPSGKFRVITLSMPSGSHKVDIKFIDTNVRKIANLVSVSTLVLLLFLMSKGRKRKV